ncbi:MAG: hypothetical protein ACYSOO_02800 [Planctomycetota bacterium]|jgi:hypothetical protein
MNERNQVGKIEFKPKGEKIESSLPSSASELKIVLDKLEHLEEHMVYMSKLLEAVVNNLSLANKKKTNASEIMKLNSKLIGGLFAGKQFEGKETFMELLNKIQQMGSE